MMKDQKIHSIHRIYTPKLLSEKSTITLMNAEYHYIRNVLRLEINNKLRIFNRSHEYLANIIELGKKEITLLIEKHIKSNIVEKKLIFAVAIIKNEKMSDMVSMLTQIGVTNIMPIITKRVVNRHFKRDKYVKVAIEAAEQCERLSIPEINEPMLFQEFMINNNSKIVYGHERLEQNTVLDFSSLDEETIFMIGPEGGFALEELQMLEEYKAFPISLGDNILRAETAALTLAAIVSFMRSM
jgi:16S rRNA (uracil1498-N3)-methyltransferase